MNFEPLAVLALVLAAIPCALFLLNLLVYRPTPLVRSADFQTGFQTYHWNSIRFGKILNPCDSRARSSTFGLAAVTAQIRPECLLDLATRCPKIAS